MRVIALIGILLALVGGGFFVLQTQTLQASAVSVTGPVGDFFNSLPFIAIILWVVLGGLAVVGGAVFLLRRG